MENIKIAPSLICMDFLNVEKQIDFLNTVADVYHFDISDHIFTNTFGLPMEFLFSIEERAKLPIDIHLMVSDVERVVDDLIDTKCDMITVHIEPISSNCFRIIDKIKRAEKKIGFAITPITPVESLKYVLPIANKITILTFDPGKAGQKLIEHTLQKITVLNSIKCKENYAFDIEADGSCNEKNFQKMLNAGANQFVVGTSGLFSLNTNIDLAWKKMKKYMG